MWRRHDKTKCWGKFKSAYRKQKNQLQIRQNELKTIQSVKEMLSNDAKTMYLVYERWNLSYKWASSRKMKTEAETNFYG